MSDFLNSETSTTYSTGSRSPSIFPSITVEVHNHCLRDHADELELVTNLWVQLPQVLRSGIIAMISAATTKCKSAEVADEMSAAC